MNKRISYILTMGALLLTALTLTGQAQGNGDASPGPGAKPLIHTDKNLVGTQVKLACTVSGPSEFPTITITNTVSASIPAGTKLYWQVNGVMKGSYTLTHALFKGMSVRFDTEAKGAGGTPAAWYFKQ
jgi:hypothetical protein